MRPQVKGILKWLYPGIGIKRWALLSFFGIVLLILENKFLHPHDFWGIQILDAVISGVRVVLLQYEEYAITTLQAAPHHRRDVVDIGIAPEHYQQPHRWSHCNVRTLKITVARPS